MSKSPSPGALSAASRATQAHEETQDGTLPPIAAPLIGTENQALMREDAEVTTTEGETVTLLQHIVTVTSDPATKVPTDVYDHEIPVLEAIHGEGNVEIVESEEIDVSEFTVEAEMDRMLRKYGTKNEGAVRQVYGDGSGLYDELGMAKPSRSGTTKRRAQQTQSLSVDNRKKNTVASEKNTAGARAVKVAPRKSTKR